MIYKILIEQATSDTSSPPSAAWTSEELCNKSTFPNSRWFKDAFLRQRSADRDALSLMPFDVFLKQTEPSLHVLLILSNHLVKVQTTEDTRAADQLRPSVLLANHVSH